MAQSLKDVESVPVAVRSVSAKKSAKSVTAPAVAAVGTSPASSTTPVLLGGAVMVLLAALVFVLLFSNNAARPVVLAGTDGGLDWSALIAEQHRALESRVKEMMEGTASKEDVAALLREQKEAVAAMRDSLLARLAEERKASEAATEALRIKVAREAQEAEETLMGHLNREIEKIASARAVSDAALQKGNGGEAAVGQVDLVARLASVEERMMQLQESGESRVAAVERALKEKRAESVVSETRGQVVKERKDFAFEVAAASPTYNDYDALSKYAIKVLGVTPKQQLITADNVVKPFVQNQCWSFSGSSGFVTVRLREPIVVGLVSLQQTAASLSFFHSNAPRDFTVSNAAGVELGSFQYDAAKSEATQSFQLLAKGDPTDTLTFRFSSNHGSDDFTCVGKIKVHRE